MEKTKHNTYLDLSKCTEEERKHIFSLLPDCYWNGQYVYNAEFAKHLKYNSYHQSWVTGLFSNDKRLKELTYTEFIKLFEGGEGEKPIDLNISKEDFIFSCDASRQNLNGRENEQEIFLAGIESVIEELNIKFNSK